MSHSHTLTCFSPVSYLHSKGQVLHAYLTCYNKPSSINMSKLSRWQRNSWSTSKYSLPQSTTLNVVSKNSTWKVRATIFSFHVIA